MRPRTPAKYVVINKDRLIRILVEKPYFHLIDRIKIAIFHDLVNEGCTMNDSILIFEKYAIDYHVRKVMIEMKRTVNERKELPDEISFVTLQANENPKCWDNYGR